MHKEMNENMIRVEGSYYIHPLANPNRPAITLKPGAYVHSFAEPRMENFEKAEVATKENNNGEL